MTNGTSNDVNTQDNGTNQSNIWTNTLEKKPIIDTTKKPSEEKIDWRTATNSFALGAGGSTYKQRTTSEKNTSNERL